jgi:hypothetical protein
MLCVLAAFPLACGTQDPDDAGEPSGGVPSSDPVRATVESYFRAVGRADGGAICARLSERLRLRVARLQSSSCERALAAEARRLPESLNAYRVVRVERTGQSAAVSLEGEGVREEMQLGREGGAWRITSAPGLGR